MHPVLWVALLVALALAALPATARAGDANFKAASADGSVVFFETDEQLVAADTDSSKDVYRRSGGVTTLVSTGPNGGNGNIDASTCSTCVSADGSVVYFVTNESLVTPDDSDSSGDVYKRSGGTTTLVSTGPNGGNAATTASLQRISADGSVAFFQTAEKLVTPDDGDNAIDIYQRSGGTTTLVSTGPNGGNANTGVQLAGVSADGSKVFFTTTEQLVTPDDGDAAQDVYQRSGGTTTLVSTGPNGGNGVQPAFFDSASADGSVVLFHTGEVLVTPDDSDSAGDIYQRSGGTTTLVSTGPNGGNGPNSVTFGGASADASVVVFTTFEKLVTPTDNDSSQDVYQRSGGVTTLLSNGPNGGNGAVDALFKGISSDGSAVFFETSEVLSADADTAPDLYQRSGAVTTNVDIGPNGGNSNSFVPIFHGASADGSKVFFRTDESLVAADTDSTTDVYQRFQGNVTLVSVRPDGSNFASQASFQGASPDGSVVFFTTDEQLVAADTDNSFDSYARSGGTTTLVSAPGDTDGDGVIDSADNCALVSNSGQTNNDGDAQGDACDPDDDNDGVLDAAPDNCQFVSNGSQTNTDGDAQGDACDPDDDNDGVLDAAPDNCALVSNSSQTNTDGDGLGDACDPDDDNDGVGDVQDNCPLNSNASQTNSDLQDGGDACDPDDDNDGLSDAAELFLATKRLDKDTDDDGISDAREVNVTKTNPKLFDTDGDGISDGVERGLTKGIADPPGAIVATNSTKFRKDLDPKTKTKVLKKDTDGDGLSDGVEDKNHNGRKDAGETSPLKKDTDGDGFNDRVDKKPLNKNQH
jgi:hypothetical protein